jgi:acetyl-CoA synthetase
VKHPAITNAAIIPIPDETRGAVIKAFVLLAPGHAGTESLKEEIREHVKRHLAPYQQPREIEFVPELPMTTTGKVQRKVLREREAGARRTAHGPCDPS